VLIVSSRFVVGVAQAGGKVPVTEFYVDEAGNEYRTDYGPVPASSDFQAIMDARLPTIDLDGMVPWKRAGE
jgi:hypothetical protein